MARYRNLLTALLGFSLIFAISSPAVAAESMECPRWMATSGTCPIDAGIVGDEVQLGGEVSTPGSGNGGGSGNGTGAGGGSASDDATPPRDPREIVRDDYTVTGPITLSDLIGFSPAPGTNHMQPNGWMIVGLDTNFYARASAQIQHGTLLGEPARVRFTPVRYHWTYGDGSRASSSTPGGTWSALRIAEFDPTPNSHVYQQPGTYYIDLTIDFAAEYTWSGSNWTPIVGTIPVPANRLVATAGSAKTVLVEHDCIINPTGPGC